MKLKNFDITCARDGSHGLQGQCGALAEHRSDSGVADSPTPQGRAQHKKFSPHFSANVVRIEFYKVKKTKHILLKT
ncbi:MAG: hypothetical protein NZ529_10180 [Cytophagaceae bacterium]|nr:hypothetical protein [Cytophagaceae bacterium]MDW8457152.1 hypothetical protein [Cytophagaceae bacterium]